MLGALARVLPMRAQPVIEPGLLDYAGTALAARIDSARRQAIADGVRPLPPAIYRSLLGFFPAALLQRARYAVGGTRRLTLPMLGFSYGDALAMTVNEVVLFRSARTAETDLKVWAHELTHVMQYQRWGIEGFADRYVRDSTGVEHEAAETADRFAAWLPRRGG